MSALKNGIVNSPIFGEIDVSPEPYAFGDSTNSMVIGERKSANLKITPRVGADVIMRPFNNLWDAEIDVDLWENGLQDIVNWLVLSKENNGLSNWRFKTPDHVWRVFQQNYGNNIGTPIGSWNLGTTFDFMCSDTERALKIKATGGGYRREYRWQNRSGSGATGGTGSTGALSGWAHLAYDAARVAPPGVVNVAVGSDYMTNLMNGTQITLSFAPLKSKRAPRNQTLLGMCEIKCEFTTENSDLAQTEDALEALVNDDTTWTIDLAPSEADITAGRGNFQIILASSVFQNAVPTYDEGGDFQTKVALTGACPVDSPAWAGNNIFWDLAANTLQLNRIGLG